MTGNENDESAGFSESVSPGALPSDREMGLTLSGQEEHHEGSSIINCMAARDSGASPPPPPPVPPLGVKLTVYRMLNMMTLLSFGTMKGILTYMGKSAAPTTLDWVSGTLLAAILYWIGLYEGRDSKKLEWLFQVDLAPAIGYCGKRTAGGIMWALLIENSILVFTALASSLNRLVSELHRLSGSPMSDYVGAEVGIIVGTTGCVVFLQYCVGAFTPRDQVRSRAWQWAMGLEDDYGPGAPLTERYWWFGAVGTVVGLFCGLALAIGLPVAVLLLIFYLM